MYRNYLPDEIDIKKLKGNAPCSECVMQNTCGRSGTCEIYQKWLKGYKARKKVKRERSK